MSVRDGISREASGKNLITFELDTRMFDRALQSFVKKYNHSVEYSVKKIGFEILRRAMLRTTRVCTGRMRNGWHNSYHKPSNWEPKTGKEKRPDPGIDTNVKTLFIQNNVFYACKIPNTDILSTNGVFSISLIKKGDRIFGWNGFDKVKEVYRYKYKGPLVKIVKQGTSDPLCVTPNDIFPIVRKKVCPYVKEYEYACREDCVRHRNKKYLTCTGPYSRIIEWVRAKDLNKDMYLVSKVFPTKNPIDKLNFTWNKNHTNQYGRRILNKFSNIDIEKELLRLIGYYLAEGALSIHARNSIQFCLNNKEKDIQEDIRNLMRKYFYIEDSKPGYKGEGIYLRFSNRRAGEFFWLFGKGSENKKVPEWVFDLDDDLIIELLRGLFLGDGSLGKKSGNYELVSCSKSLGIQISILLERLSIPCWISEIKSQGGKEFINPDGYRCKNKSIWRIGFSSKFGERLGLSSVKKTTKNLFWSILPTKVGVLKPIKNIETIDYDGYVYDLAMEKFPAFWANGVHIHNSFHEFGTVHLQPLLMLTVPVQEMRGEMENYLLKDMEPLWNKEINGVTGFGLTKAAKISKAAFLKRFPRTAKRGVCSKTKKRKRSTR